MPKIERLSRGLLKIGELALRLGIPATTIRYYTDIGILKVVAETQGGYRLYDVNEALGRMTMIRQIKGSSPTLQEAKALMDQETGEVLVA